MVREYADRIYPQPERGRDFGPTVRLVAVVCFI